MIGEKCYCGLDMGSQKIKAGLIKVKDVHQMELLGICEKKTYGFKDEAVTDLGELAECIHGAVQTLSEKTGVKIKEVQLGVGAGLIDVRETGTVIPLVDRGHKVIIRSDIKKVNDQARLLGLQMEEEILHEVPQHYVVDEANTTLNPLGLCGRKLGVRSMTVIADAGRVRNIVRAVQQAGYDVVGVSLSGYAASHVTLDERERREGCLLLDIGSKATTALFWKDQILKCLKKMDIGGEHFTQSIAEGLNLSLDLAEEIKKSYATAINTDQGGEEEILVKRDTIYAPIRRQDISASIEPQIQRFLEKMGSLTQETGLMDQMSWGIVVIGGGALLTGLIERMGQAAGRPVHLGKIHISSKRSLGNAALFSAVAGLAQSGFKKGSGNILSSGEKIPWTQRMANRLRELYQEYF